MNDPKYFKDNLRAVKEKNNLPLMKFSKKLNMPQTTVHSIIQEGQTTPNTACKMANALQMPLCTMPGGKLEDYKAEVIHGFMNTCAWYGNMADNKRTIVCKAFADIISVLESDD